MLLGISFVDGWNILARYSGRLQLPFHHIEQLKNALNAAPWSKSHSALALIFVSAAAS
jgi:hypothetical protein